MGDGDEHHEQVGHAFPADGRGGHEGHGVGDVVVVPVQLGVQPWGGIRGESEGEGEGEGEGGAELTRVKDDKKA